MSVTADTSVVIPALAAWHESHTLARAACRGVTALPTQALLESISVLTRLPGGLAVPSAVAVRVLRQKFPATPLVLTAEEYADLADAVGAHGLRGGQVYDALVALTAASHKARLLSLDKRAVRTYQTMGVEVELLAGTD